MTQHQHQHRPDSADHSLQRVEQMIARLDALPPIHQSPKRNFLWLWITLAVIAATVIGIGLYYGPSLNPAPTTHTVRYDAEADAATGGGRTGMVTAQTADGGTTQGTGPLPYSDVLDGFHAGDFVYISVQNQQPAGSVTCRITVDGVVVSENTSSGGYTIATCQGTVPR